MCVRFFAVSLTQLFQLSSDSRIIVLVCNILDAFLLSVLGADLLKMGSQSASNASATCSLM